MKFIEGCGFVVFPPVSLAWELEFRLHRQWLRRCKRRAAGAGEATGRMGLIGGGCAVACWAGTARTRAAARLVSPVTATVPPPHLGLDRQTLPCVLGVAQMHGSVRRSSPPLLNSGRNFGKILRLILLSPMSRTPFHHTSAVTSSRSGPQVADRSMGHTLSRCFTPPFPPCRFSHL